MKKSNFFPVIFDTLNLRIRGFFQKKNEFPNSVKNPREYHF